MPRKILVTLIATLCALATRADSAERPRAEKVSLGRAELGLIESQQLFIDCAVHSGSSTYLTLFCLDVSDDPKKAVVPEESVRKQLVPSFVKWVVRGEDGKIVRWWLAHFMDNRDSFRHTMVKMPPAELKRTELEVYFETDSHAKPRDLTVTIKCDEFNWKAQGEWQRPNGGSTK